VTLRLPLIVTEADAHLGVANKLLAPFARRVCLAFDLDGHEDEKYLVTGRPIAPRSEGLTKTAARQKFGLPEGGRCLLVFGGSLGARNINRATLDAFEGGLPDDLCVLHLTGRGDFEAAKEILDSHPEIPDDRYRLLDFTNEFDVALAAADISVCRAGGSIFELAAAGLPAILVPYPHATADHQALNAKWLTDGDAAVMIRDEVLNGGSLRGLLDPLLADPARLDAMRANALELAMPDAADQIARELIEVAG
jgi:UDP-N-acetylglucosamine--N-acetylmuramyl-(pentapeptide) pyrophosphoryl-undecaprenol N-acetylglucosamine transferase